MDTLLLRKLSFSAAQINPMLNRPSQSCASKGGGDDQGELTTAAHSCKYRFYERRAKHRKMWLVEGAEEIRRNPGLTGEPLPPSAKLVYSHSNVSLYLFSVVESSYGTSRAVTRSEHLPILKMTYT
ncbi:hypothetical protein GGR54DRAFT_619616 [Hypoxylon sp. NC1633]|nr:hypothetical protein GGR54DRAFT_619616 [Hypoxylon sp. NC1633]